LKETRLVVGEFPYKLLNGDVAVPLWAVNFRKQILASPLWFASLVLICSTFTFLLLDRVGVLVFEFRDHYAACDHLQELLKNLSSCYKSREDLSCFAGLLGRVV
jgi:hypothetical protein